MSFNVIGGASGWVKGHQTKTNLRINGVHVPKHPPPELPLDVIFVVHWCPQAQHVRQLTRLGEKGDGSVVLAD